MTETLDVDKIKTILHEFATIRDWNQFHNPKNLVMALASESGELLEIFQWLSEADAVTACKNPAIKEKTRHELADILLYLIRIASLMEINLADAVFEKISINNDKYPAEQVKGSAKKYTEY